jgi:hypothetical protein
MPDVPFILKRGGETTKKKKLVGVVAMPADIRTGHLPETPAELYHYTNLLLIMTEL